MRATIVLMFLLSYSALAEYKWGVYLNEQLTNHISMSDRLLESSLVAVLIHLRDAMDTRCIGFEFLSFTSGSQDITFGGQHVTSAPCGDIRSSGFGLYIGRSEFSLSIRCPEILWIQLTIVKIDVPYRSVQCSLAGITFRNLKGEPSATTYCGNRKPEELYAHRHLTIIQYVAESAPQRLVVHLSYQFIDRKTSVLIRRHPFVLDDDPLHACTSTNKQETMCDILLKMDQVPPHTLDVLSGVKRLNLMFYSGTRSDLAILLDNIRIPFDLYEGPGMLSPKIDTTKLPTRWYRARNMAITFLTLELPANHSDSFITIIHLHRVYKWNRVTNSKPDQIIDCFQEGYQINLAEGPHEITMKFADRQGINNWCHLHVTSPYTFTLNLTFNGFSHYIQNDDILPCHSGGIFAVNRSRQALHAFCRTMNIQPYSVNTDPITYLKMIFYTGYSSGLAIFTLIPMKYFPIFLSLDQFKCKLNVCSADYEIWSKQEIFMVDFKVKERVKQVYVMNPHSPGLGRVTKKRFNIDIIAGRRKNGLTLGLVNIIIAAQCSGTAICQTSLVEFASKTDEVFNTVNLEGSIDWNVQVANAMYVHIRITLDDPEGVRLQIVLEKLQRCFYDMADQLVKQIPYESCEHISIPFATGKAYLQSQLFQSIRVGLDKECTLRKCTKLSVTAKPQIPTWPTLFWENTNLERTNIEIKLPGDLKLSWEVSASDSCRSLLEQDHGDQCDMKLTVGIMKYFSSDYIHTERKNYVILRPTAYLEEITFREM